jgi:hypothetical protein
MSSLICTKIFSSSVPLERLTGSAYMFNQEPGVELARICVETFLLQ